MSRNFQYDYPPEWDEPDYDDERTIDEDDFVEPDDDDYGYVDDRLTDLEIRYNRDY